MTLQPWIIKGTLSGTSYANCPVYAYNATTGETISTTSDSNGHYIINCADFPSGYTNGDVIHLMASQGTLFAQTKCSPISKTANFSVFQTDKITVE